jgi:hypothetical protein
VRLSCSPKSYQLDVVKAIVVVVLTLLNIWVPVLYELLLHRKLNRHPAGLSMVTLTPSIVLILFPCRPAGVQRICLGH